LRLEPKRQPEISNNPTIETNQPHQSVKHLLSLALIPVATLALTQCVVDQNGNLIDPSTGTPVQLPADNAGYTQPLTSVNGQGTVVIMEGNRRLSVCHTASPNVEQTRWHRGQQQIVVKSRGNHGPATVQLFDTRSGREVGRVMAYDIANGGPGWAVGMGE
jgi:hypothetical protein